TTVTPTAARLAVPQIRSVGTLSISLLLRNRSWYSGNPSCSCHQDGGQGCPAREGDHRHGTVFDTSPCVAPHPSSMAAALLVYDAAVEVVRPGSPEGASLPAADLYDPADGARDHVLGSGDLLTAVLMPPPAAGE